MQAVLLAAGNSSRFYPYNQSFEHKALVKIMGKTILEHTLEAIKNNGIKDIIIVTSPKSKIPELLGNGEKFGISITYREHSGAQGMGAALLEAKDVIKETFFLLNAYHMDLGDFAEDMQKKHNGSNIVLLGRKEKEVSAFGYMTVEGEKVTGIIEKPKLSNTEMLRLIGIYILPVSFISLLEKTPLSHYHFEEALDAFSKENNVLSVLTERKSLTLKYVTDLFAIKDYLLEKIKGKNVSEKTQIAESAEIAGDVIIEENVKVMEGACIKGPAYIGKGVTVGNRAIVRNGVVAEENSVIGSQMEIKNTLVMEESTTHSGFIGDSLIGENTKIAAGFVTANARLDRKEIKINVKEEKISTGINHLGAIIGSDCNIGIRVETMPGVIIGNNVIVGPSTTVMKDIQDNTKYYTKFQEIIETHKDE